MGNRDGDYIVFVSSSDSYSDIWDVFFDMFHFYWPTYNGLIYLQTQERVYQRKDLKIKCTTVGKELPFGAALRAGLDMVPSDNILFFMIDYLIMGKVNADILKECYQYFVNKELNAFYLTNQDLPMIMSEDNIHIGKMMESEHMFNYQIAFWKKETFKQMALPHENPWTSEWYGNKRAIEAHLNICTICDSKYEIFKYNHAGCLHRGKWLPDAVEFLKKKNYIINFEDRGFYNNEYRSLFVRLKLKMTFILHGLKGSYWCRIRS